MLSNQLIRKIRQSMVEDFYDNLEIVMNNGKCGYYHSEFRMFELVLKITSLQYNLSEKDRRRCLLTLENFLRWETASEEDLREEIRYCLEYGYNGRNVSDEEAQEFLFQSLNEIESAIQISRLIGESDKHFVNLKQIFKIIFDEEVKELNIKKRVRQEQWNKKILGIISRCLSYNEVEYNKEWSLLLSKINDKDIYSINDALQLRVRDEDMGYVVFFLDEMDNYISAGYTESLIGYIATKAKEYSAVKAHWIGVPKLMGFDLFVDTVFHLGIQSISKFRTGAIYVKYIYYNTLKKYLSEFKSLSARDLKKFIKSNNVTLYEVGQSKLVNVSQVKSLLM